ncbi:MAG: hypothetical protein IPK53_01635 [bacterium]|nr:hypothetical protein [bacterium]
MPKYRDDRDHFTHVYECLFRPAIEAAGFEPIPPSSRGSEIIQADIIHNLEDSDLVLCDISILNPNVFFELGVRTALNKPVCLLRDSLTENIPFDTGMINHYTYDAALFSWKKEGDINLLKEHILESVKRSGAENSLWKYLGMRLHTQSSGPPLSVEEKIEYLSGLIQTQINESRMITLGPRLHDLSYSPIERELPIKQILDAELKSIAAERGIMMPSITWVADDAAIVQFETKTVDQEIVDRLKGRARQLRISAIIMNRSGRQQ